MKVLSIGNSFSQDAHRYLHRLAKREGVNLKAVNLDIGGCTLQTHYLNMLDDVSAYSFELNGENTGIKYSMRQGLVSDDWDFVTLQQASPLSGREESYFPYIEELAKYVRKYCPNTKIVLHETWAYENGSEHLKNVGFQTSEEMFTNLQAAYKRAAQVIEADGIIPCGTAMYRLSQTEIGRVHRDMCHADLGVGRYSLALTWYAFLTGKKISDNTFDEFDVPVSENERLLAIQVVNEIFKG